MQLNHINGAIKAEVSFRAVYSLAEASNAPSPRSPDDVVNHTLPPECKTNYVETRWSSGVKYLSLLQRGCWERSLLAPRWESGGGSNSKEQLQAFSPFIFHPIII